MLPNDVPETILNLMQCPLTGNRLVAASAELIERLNQKIAAGELENKIGQTIRERFDAGLVSVESRWFFGFRNGILSLVAEEAVDLRTVTTGEN